MKRKERAHLKEDPLVSFIKKVLEYLKGIQKQILLGLGIIVSALVVIILIVFLNKGSVKKENRVYAQAMEIKNAATLSFDEKIEQLNGLRPGGGISSSLQLMKATLYYEKGELEKSKEILDQFSSSKLKMVNDQKIFLEAEILNATNKKREALDKFFQLYSDSKSEISKDYLLLIMAKIRVQTQEHKAAITDLNTLLTEHSQSMFKSEATALLTQLENKK
jgi:outer membrane PBP1 activator LpoA protein